MSVDSAILTEAAVMIDKGFQDTFSAGIPPGDLDPIPLLCKTITTNTKTVKAIVNGIVGQWREWLGERVYHDLSRYAFSFQNRTFELSAAVNVDDLSDDQYGGFGDIGAGMAQEGLALPRDLLTSALLAGTTTNGFDGQYFFDTDHPVDPANTNSATYTNYTSSGMALTDANLKIVMTRVRQLKGPTGRLLGVRPKYLLVPPELEFQARLLVAPAAVAAVTNVLSGALEVVVLDPLSAEPTGWYVLGEARGMKPFINSVLMPPKITVQNAPTDEGVFAHNRVYFGGKARGNVVPALPFLMYKAVA